MEESLHNKVGDIVIEKMGEGFRVIPESEVGNSGCDSCGGDCS